MLGRDRRIIPLELLKDFEEQDGFPAELDELKSALIIEYERALDGGVNPLTALQAVIDWASGELRRNAALLMSEAQQS